MEGNGIVRDVVKVVNSGRKRVSEAVAKMKQEQDGSGKWERLGDQLSVITSGERPFHIRIMLQPL